MEPLFVTKSVQDIEQALALGVAPHLLLGLRDQRRREELVELIHLAERMSGDLQFFSVMLSDLARRLHELSERT
jgi:hypothetical protein